MPLAAPGPHRVDVRRAVLHDGSRNRELPITAFVPGLAPARIHAT